MNYYYSTALDIPLARNILMGMGVGARKLIDQGVSRSDAMSFVLSEAMANGGSSMPKTWQAFMQVAPSYGLAWAENAFSTVELSHKLAASIACSSISESVVSNELMPWRCFAVLVPADVICEGPCFTLVLRVRNGNSVNALTLRSGSYVISFQDNLSGYADIGDGWNIEGSRGNNEQFNPETFEQVFPGGIETERRFALLHGRVLIGSCLEMLSRPAKAAISATPSEPKSKRGLPRPYVYRLSRDISLDLRSEVRDYIAGRRASSPKVQVLVRGHYKQQPHGPSLSLRKLIHVEPYWRGPESAPIAVRSHVIDGDA